MRERLLYYAIKYDGDYNKIKKAMDNNEKYKIIKYDGNYICICDEQYPNTLKELKNPPFVLFYEGDSSLLYKSAISVVGSRDISVLGKSYVQTLLKYLNKEYVIISGMARGVDGFVHEFALTSHQTIGVIGCGLNITYPLENDELYKKMRQQQLLISEYPNGVKPYAWHFPMRNRIIAALGKCLVVIEAKKRSGTLLTVNEALELAHEIFCFPHPFIENEVSGCNLLIESGASVMVDVERIKDL